MVSGSKTTSRRAAPGSTGPALRGPLGVARIGIDSWWFGLSDALMRPLSGSGARGLMLETMEVRAQR